MAEHRLRPLYTVRQLADLMGLEYRVTYHLIQTSRLRTIRSGARIFIPLSSFKRGLPEVWESLLIIESLRKRSS